MRKERLARLAAILACTVLIAGLSVQQAVANLSGCSNCIEASDIATGAVRASELNDDLDDSITANDLAAGSVGTSELSSAAEGNLRSRVWAQMDGSGSGTSTNDLTTVTVNTVTFTAPEAGVVVITGQIYVNNQEATASADLILSPFLDGAEVQNGEGGWSGWLNPDGQDGTNQGTNGYTVAAPVTAGAHTVTQVLGTAGGTPDIYWDRNNLIVEFYPVGSFTETTEG